MLKHLFLLLTLCAFSKASSYQLTYNLEKKEIIEMLNNDISAAIPLLLDAYEKNKQLTDNEISKLIHLRMWISDITEDFYFLFRDIDSLKERNEQESFNRQYIR